MGISVGFHDPSPRMAGGELGSTSRSVHRARQRQVLNISSIDPLTMSFSLLLIDHLVTRRLAYPSRMVSISCFPLVFPPMCSSVSRGTYLDAQHGKSRNHVSARVSPEFKHLLELLVPSHHNPFLCSAISAMEETHNSAPQPCMPKNLGSSF